MPVRRSSRRPAVGAALTLAALAVCSGLVGAGRGALASAGPAGARLAVPAASGAACAATAPTGWQEALAALGRSRLRCPGSRPDPSRPAGTDLLAGIDHVVVLMMENHSYDNLLGMLPRGDGFTLGPGGVPTATNPYPTGDPTDCPAGTGTCVQHAFHMPTTCQLSSRPSQEWQASHNAYDGGRMDGFVRTPISPADPAIVGGVAMGYWAAQDLPFTYSLASRFAVGDRWFSATLAQTDPERRFLIAGTSSGMTDDIGTGPGNAIPDAGLAVPAPTIFNELDTVGVSWADYVAGQRIIVPGQPQPDPEGATPNLYPTTDGATEQRHVQPFSRFYDDARSGALPSFTLLDEDYGTQSQENPQNIVVGEEMMARVVAALGASPDWPSTLLVVTYDEHGGYYDHVPPPVALPPDPIPPQVQPGESTYEGFARYGFRVPAIVVSPYARPGGYVTHVLHDHTSILAMVERRWNLPALTWRDANANDLTDFLDMAALARHRPVFAELPTLAAPAPDGGCPHVTIPPAGSVTAG